MLAASEAPAGPLSGAPEKTEAWGLAPPLPHDLTVFLSHRATAALGSPGVSLGPRAPSRCAWHSGHAAVFVCWAATGACQARGTPRSLSHREAGHGETEATSPERAPPHPTGPSEQLAPHFPTGHTGELQVILKQNKRRCFSRSPGQTNRRPQPRREDKPPKASGTRTPRLRTSGHSRGGGGCNCHAAHCPAAPPNSPCDSPGAHGLAATVAQMPAELLVQNIGAEAQPAPTAQGTRRQGPNVPVARDNFHTFPSTEVAFAHSTGHVVGTSNRTNDFGPDRGQAWEEAGKVGQGKGGSHWGDSYFNRDRL